MRPTATSTVLMFTDRRKDIFAPTIERLGLSAQDDVGLTILPERLTPASRILDFSAHTHADHNYTHWQFGYVPPPGPTPPDSIVENSRRQGFVEGFLDNFVNLVGSEPMDVRAEVAFVLSTKKWASKFLPRKSRGPKGAKDGSFIARWSFEAPATLRAIKFELLGDEFVVTINLSARLALGRDMFGMAEELAWNSSGKLVTAKKSR